MKKICFVQTDLNVGGIQKSLFNLLRNIDYGKYQIDLFLFEKGGFFEGSFPKELNVIYLDHPGKKYSFMKFEKVVKKLSFALPEPDKEYDLAVDFNSYQNICAALVNQVKAKRKVMWVHNDVGIKLKGEWKYRVLWHFFKGKFKIFDRFITVSDGLIEPFSQKAGVPKEKMETVCNYIDVEEILEKSKEDPQGFCPDPACFHFVAVGRLCYQKGYDILLEHFAKAVSRRPELRLHIVGDGEDRAELEERVGRLKLKDKVNFLGNQSNPFSYMARCDAFVSTSRYEGQGMNVMEAKVLGMPLYITKNLEKYNSCGVVGVEDLSEAMVTAVPVAQRVPDLLTEYNQKILDSIQRLTEFDDAKEA